MKKGISGVVSSETNHMWRFTDLKQVDRKNTPQKPYLQNKLAWKGEFIFACEVK